MSTEVNGGRGGRSRGRPRLEIDRDAVADAVAELFAEGGIEAVSIADTAEKLSVSRATLYRTVPTKEDLLGILFERSTRELTERAEAALDALSDPGAQLEALITLQADAAIQMRSYMPVFFGGGGLPPDVFMRWRKWSRQYERQWAGVVEACMDAGYLDKADPLVATRLILGMIIWVSRWYRPAEKITAEQIADSAITLLRLRVNSDGSPRRVPPRRRPRA
jgi:AcrR family transcriptional regulator